MAGWHDGRRSGTLPLLAALALLSLCAACGGETSGCNTAMVQVGEVTYEGQYPSGSYAPGRALREGDLGPEWARSGPEEVCLLPAGTPVFRVRGYAPGYRLAAREADGITLIEAQRNPRARRGGELLDIEGEVRSIDITDAGSGREIAALTGPREVRALVTMVVQAPVDQGIVERGYGGEPAHFLTFYLADGTASTRPYWPRSGLYNGIVVPRAFDEAVARAAGGR